MVTKQQAYFEVIDKKDVPLFCPTEDHEGKLCMVSQNGEVYRESEGQMVLNF
jgi:hypothetical protein